MELLLIILIAGAIILTIIRAKEKSKSKKKSSRKRKQTPTIISKADTQYYSGNISENYPPVLNSGSGATTDCEYDYSMMVFDCETTGFMRWDVNNN